MINQSGASEMYLNGQLIHNFGVLNTNPNKIKAFNPQDKPISFPLSTDSIQVLCIRYALQPAIEYATHFGMENSGLKITLITTEKAINFNFFILYIL